MSDFWNEHILDFTMDHPVLSSAVVLGVYAASVIGIGIAAEAQENVARPTPPPAGRPANWDALGNAEDQTQTLNALRAEKEALERQEQNQKAQTRECLDKARYLLEQIQTHRHDFFLPGCTEEIQASIRQAEDFVREHLDQAAHAEAFHASRTARTYLDRVLALEIEWEEARLALQERLDSLTRFGDLCEARIRTDAGEETVALDLDYWTGGARTRLREGIPEFREDLTTGALRERAREAGALLEQMQVLPQAAVDAFIDSRLRAELCDSVYQTLLARGWTLAGEQAFGYEGGDDRQPVFLCMHNAVGDRLSFQFGERGQLQANLAFHKASSRGLRDHLAAAVRNALADCSFHITDFQILDSREGLQ